MMVSEVLDLSAEVAQAAVGLCFGWAAIAKLIWFRDFEQGVAGFEVVRSESVRSASLIVIALEAVVAFSFPSGRGLLAGTIVAVLLLAVFCFVMGYARCRGIATVCMCFGPDGSDSTSLKTLLRLSLLGAGVALVLIDLMYGSAAPQPPRVASIVAGVCILAGCSAVLELPELLAVVAGRPDNGRADGGK